MRSSTQKSFLLTVAQGLLYTTVTESELELEMCKVYMLSPGNMAMLHLAIYTQYYHSVLMQGVVCPICSEVKNWDVDILFA